MATLQQFLQAQDAVWPQVTAELRAGRKTSHWIWFVFPQLASLGRSGTAKHYGLADLGEAEAYLAEPTLRARLIEAAELLLGHEERDPETILGAVDALKVRSSMTLFEAVPGAPPVFAEILDRLYAGSRCPHTLAALA